MAKQTTAKPEVPVAEHAPADKKPKNKTTCPISRKEFIAKAPPIEIVIAGHKFTAGPREFSTGSVGYNVSEKFTEIIDGKVVTFQVGCNITAVGSKDLPKE